MSLRTLSIALACSALTALAVTPARAETDPAVIAHGYKAPRDAWGRPDLTGTWSPATITRLERDPKLGDRLVLTAAEAKALEGATADNNAQASKPTDQKLSVDEVDCGVKGFSGVACGYNNFWVDPGTKVMRIAGEPRSSIIVSPKDGRLPMKPEALARERAAFGNAQMGNFDGPERRPLAERCLVGFGSTSGPPMLPVLYNNHYAIAQSKDQVAIQVEMVHDLRLLRVGGPHEPASIRKWMGDSVARWQGETLVVDTVNFRPDQTFRGAGANMHVIERLTRISPTQMLYQFRVEDPDTFAEPVSGEEAWNLTKDHIYEYACHEGNYALPGILGGARRAEQQGKEMEGNRGQVKEEGER
ncbi:MAG TPA: hypothetical protein VNW53_00150 [Phenylobacterium sp.]|jgi:hypothetical protein|uniref:hypothetical protein n=1 Tax=Phenylobacterium sp. TaxID=1871053 RepID=UPI002C7743AF|nr:hypothetical protein [Phenylobacterium sp.]HXA37384.1 hypothetical protein [Phenylobacterium sp.]